MVVFGIKNLRFFYVKGQFTENQRFAIHKVYETAVQGTVEENLQKADVIRKFLESTGFYSEMDTDVSISVSNQFVKKYIFSTDSSIDPSQLRFLLTNELEHSLDLYFNPDDYNYYLISQNRQVGEKHHHIVLALEKNILRLYEQLKKELDIEQAALVPEWNGLQIFLNESMTNSEHVIILDQISPAVTEITVVKNGQIIHVFQVMIEKNKPESVVQFLNDFIQLHFPDNKPFLMDISEDVPPEIAENLQLPLFPYQQIAGKFDLPPNFGLQSVKSFFSFIGMFK